MRIGNIVFLFSPAKRRVAAEAEEEFNMMRRYLFEIRHSPNLAKTLKELLPLLRFADRRYSATHSGPFISLESTATQLLQRRVFQ
jgi:hypothetical protein